MKKYLCFLPLFLFLNISAAQTDTIFYDSNWREINNKKNAEFFRVQTVSPSNKITVKDYWMTGELQMDGSYLFSTNKENRTGKFYYYFKNGSIEWQVNYKNGEKDGEQISWYGKDSIEEISHYKNGKLNGDLISFYENGDTSSIEHYINDEETGVFKYWYENKKMSKIIKYNINGVDSIFTWYENGNKETEGELSEYGPYFIKYKNHWDDSGNQTINNGEGFVVHKNSRSFWFGNVTKGFLNGNMLKYDLMDLKNPNRKPKGKMKFKNGKFIKGFHYFKGKKVIINDEFESDPVFRGKEKKLLKYISFNLKYYLIQNNCKNFIANKVYVQFVVKYNGKIDDVKIVSGQTSECQKKSILEIINNMPTWIPGSQNGFFVNVRFMIPLVFKH